MKNYLTKKLNIKLENILSKEICEEIIQNYGEFHLINPIETTKDKLIDESIIEYDLDIGDGFIFAPTRLGHKAVPPKEDKIRHTISFTIFPNSFFGK